MLYRQMKRLGSETWLMTLYCPQKMSEDHTRISMYLHVSSGAVDVLTLSASSFVTKYRRTSE